jgi:hypothetical protein
MTAWRNADRYRAITESAERRAAQSERLISQIVNALAASGEFVATLALEPAQQVVDLKWAARQAGRLLGMRIDIHQTISKASDQTHVRVVGTPLHI